MSKLVINGVDKLFGEITLQGAKNSALPVLSASYLCNGESVITNCPNITDVHNTFKILKLLGCKVKYKNNVALIDSTDAFFNEIDENIMKSMRSSVIFLGAMITKTHYAEIYYPGGCELGLRPIDIHLDALSRMGAKIVEQNGKIICTADGNLTGCTIDLPIASVGATENIMLAAVLAEGTTVIRNAAKEPEIVDLAEFLIKCGAKIKGHGGTEIVITGVRKLSGCEHKLIPDRVVAATYLCAAALNKGEICLKGVNANHLVSVLPCYEQMGCTLKVTEDNIILSSDKRLNKLDLISTKEYPGFPTDIQPLMLAACIKSCGTSMFVENIFSGRYKYVDGLIRMGANIKVADRVAVVNGVNKIHSANSFATDLRGGAALVIAAVGAEGKSIINQTDYIDRGYENFEENLISIGADIKREN
ncbi:MAG: UDP-N-acetylglucosamine 1-carboxyvinyltransferase [Acutalibacteraceae bacterium]|nr:UDP-N-acetylglucosamine 1-carboxyvinyltransferase [Acutalibacteraceae bacterium]